MDETGISIIQKAAHILATTGVKQLRSAVSWECGKNVTVICCFNAAGTYIPPLFIFSRKRMSTHLCKVGLAGAIYKFPDNGWSNIF